MSPAGNMQILLTSGWVKKVIMLPADNNVQYIITLRADLHLNVKVLNDHAEIQSEMRRWVCHSLTLTVYCHLHPVNACKGMIGSSSRGALMRNDFWTVDGWGWRCCLHGDISLSLSFLLLSHFLSLFSVLIALLVHALSDLLMRNRFDSPEHCWLDLMMMLTAVMLKVNFERCWIEGMSVDECSQVMSADLDIDWWQVSWPAWVNEIKPLADAPDDHRPFAVKGKPQRQIRPIIKSEKWVTQWKLTDAVKDETHHASEKLSDSAIAACQPVCWQLSMQLCWRHNITYEACWRHNIWSMLTLQHMKLFRMSVIWSYSGCQLYEPIQDVSDMALCSSWNERSSFRVYWLYEVDEVDEVSELLAGHMNVSASVQLTWWSRSIRSEKYCLSQSDWRNTVRITADCCTRSVKSWNAGPHQSDQFIHITWFWMLLLAWPNVNFHPWYT